LATRRRHGWACARSATGQHGNSNARVAGKLFESCRECVGHLFVEEDSIGAAERHDSDAIIDGGLENIGVHGILLRSADFFSVALTPDVKGS
jgi:hypothetical protein